MDKNMRPFKFSTTVSSKGTIKIPFSKKLIGRNVEVTIIPKSNSKETDLSANDFEDAVQVFSANYNGVETIITRNKKDFRKSNLEILTPEELIQQIK
jgi:hypothetical protein